MSTKPKKPDYIIYTDGASRGNPGDASIGVVICGGDGAVMKSYGERLGVATNNDAEYAAIVYGLKKLKSLVGSNAISDAVVEVRMDSQLAQRQLTHQYRVTEERLFAPFIAIWNLMIDYREVRFIHIPREKNRTADALANQALDAPEQRPLI
ncbi:MAG: ribonuclease HI family protein [Patescibacteria group bacterium]